MFCGVTCHLDPLATFELYIYSTVMLNEVGASPSSCFNPEFAPNLIVSCCCHFNEYNQFRWKFKFREYFYSNPPTNKNLTAINFMFPTFPQCLFHWLHLIFASNFFFLRGIRTFFRLFLTAFSNTFVSILRHSLVQANSILDLIKLGRHLRTARFWYLSQNTCWAY